MAGMPTGTVTLLFTDIEGSTRRWEALPAAMATALATHDDLLRFAIEAHGGVVFKTVGDAFCAAFADAGDALRACLVAQRSLAATDWGAVGHVRVRMALHTGEPEHRERDYFGPPVNRVARLLSTGFGGQVLVSAATAEQLAAHLPADVTLRDLGAHRLKDLLQPERVYQVAAPGLEAEFPPLKSLDRQPHNLPAQPTPLVGREAEVAAARELLDGGARLVTLTGPGGTGKTRLGLQVAAELVDALRDGAWFVGLAPLTEAGLVVGAIAAALGVRETGHEPLETTLMEYLAAKEMLLLLDNFEHVTAAAPLVGRILATCPKVRLLVTSRAGLRVYGEREVPVPPLGLPDLKRLPPLAALAEVPAVELFVERAQAVKPGFALAEANARTVAELVVKLEGLPLAIELAAARVRILAPAQLLARLSSRLGLLTGGAADRDERQRTLRGAIAWSHDLLPDSQQVLFRRLAVFAGGAYEAIEAVADPDGTLDVLDGLEALVSQSLMRQEEQADGPRFFMLETIREFAAEQLAASGEAAAIRRAHAEQYLALAEDAEPQLTGAGQEEWLHRLAAEHDNLRAALAVFAQTQRPAEELRLAAALWRFWDAHGHLTEGRQYLERALANPDGAPPAARIAALNGAGVLAHVQGDLDRAVELHEAEARLGSEIGDKRAVASAAYNLGVIASIRGDYLRATEQLEQARGLFDEIGHERGAAVALGVLYDIARYQDDLDRAEALAKRSLAVYRKLDDAQLIGLGLLNLGTVASLRKQWAEAVKLNQEAIEIATSLGNLSLEADALVALGYARGHLDPSERSTAPFEQALSLFRTMGDVSGTAYALDRLARAELANGDPTRARDLEVESFQLRKSIGYTRGVAQCLEAISAIACTMAKHESGVLLCGAADALRASLGAPVHGAERDELDGYLAQARAVLGDAAFDAAWSIGGMLSADQALQEALEDLG